MADVQMPASIPCQFDARGWNPCKKPSDNGWCSEHEGLKCSSCGAQAITQCDAQMGGLACGSTLCDSCVHHNGTHITKEVYAEIRRLEQEEEKAKTASRTSSVQRLNEELGVPLNLFELLKGDMEEWSLQHVYYLELDHGLMGFFPAIYNDEKQEIVVTTDVNLLIELWRTLEPRKSKVGKIRAYVDSEGRFAYPNKDRQREQEDVTPTPLLTRDKFEDLHEVEDEPFRWAFGLIGAGSNPDQFARIIERTVEEYRVAM